VTKNYQTNADDANALAVPEQASVAMDEIAADMREGELPVRAYELFNSTELLGRMGMERMLAGVSTQALKFAITSSRRGARWHGPSAVEGNDIFTVGRQAIRPSPASLPAVIEVLIDRIFYITWRRPLNLATVRGCRATHSDPILEAGPYAGLPSE
jgi:hypothetical protein